VRSCLLIALILVTAACTSGSGDDADSLSELLEPPTTLAPPNTLATTPTPTPSTTATLASATTTIAETTEVLSDADSEAQAIQELPLTGGESQAAFVALLMLALGAWLVRRANVAQSIIDRIRANLTRP
jgi:hypothetical protein